MSRLLEINTPLGAENTVLIHLSGHVANMPASLYKVTPIPAMHQLAQFLPSRNAITRTAVPEPLEAEIQLDGEQMRIRFTAKGIALGFGDCHPTQEMGTPTPFAAISGTRPGSAHYPDRSAARRVVWRVDGPPGRRREFPVPYQGGGHAHAGVLLAIVEIVEQRVPNVAVNESEFLALNLESPIVGQLYARHGVGWIGGKAKFDAGGCAESVLDGATLRTAQADPFFCRGHA